MSNSRDQYGDDNVARLNAFLDRFPETCDPDFDDQGDSFDRELATFRTQHNDY